MSLDVMRGGIGLVSGLHLKSNSDVGPGVTSGMRGSSRVWFEGGEIALRRYLKTVKRQYDLYETAPRPESGFSGEPVRPSFFDRR